MPQARLRVCCDASGIFGIVFASLSQSSVGIRRFSHDLMVGEVFESKALVTTVATQVKV